VTPYEELLRLASTGADIAKADVDALDPPPNKGVSAFRREAVEALSTISAMAKAGARGPARRDARAFAAQYRAAFREYDESAPQTASASSTVTPEVDRMSPVELAAAVRRA
jgi:hypothetical protein